LLRHSGSYAVILQLCAGACVLGPALLLTLGRTPRHTHP
jgi:hypothetical protein